MTFEKWVEKYYPNEKDTDVLKKMSHAFASGHVSSYATGQDDLRNELRGHIDSIRQLLRWPDVDMDNFA